MPITDTTCSCPSKQRTSAEKSTYPFLSGLLIVLIPKCPYCILAYSSAITMCSGTKISHTLGWASYLPITLAALTLLLVLFNYKGKRTIAAAILVLLGSACMLTGEFYTGNINLYYIGTFLLLFGVWVNASFRYFYRKWIRPLINIS